MKDGGHTVLFGIHFYFILPSQFVNSLTKEPTVCEWLQRKYNKIMSYAF